MSEVKKTDSKQPEPKPTTAAGSSSEEQPLLTTEAKKLIEYATSQHFVAIRDETRGTIALMPVGWVGEPALVIAEIKLADLKDLLKQL